MTMKMTKDKNAILAVAFGAVAVISSFIDVWNWFFWVFTIIGLYFAVKALRSGEKTFGWIAVGLCALSIATYSLVRWWPESTGDSDEIETEQEHREYQEAVDNANHYDVTADPTDVESEPAQEDVKEDAPAADVTIVEEVEPSPENPPVDNPAPDADDPETQSIFD